MSGVVRVNVLSSFALRWLLPRLSEFQESYSSVEVKISTTSRKLRYVGTAFDIGIRSGVEHGSGIQCETLMPDRRLPVCSPGNPARPSGGNRARFATARPVAFHDDAIGVAAMVFGGGRPGLAPVRHLELDHVYLQLQAAVDGLGVALGSLPLIEADIAAGRLVCPIAAPELRADDYQLVIRDDRLRDPAIKAFRSWILAAAREPLAGIETPLRPGISQDAKRGPARPSRGATRPSK